MKNEMFVVLKSFLSSPLQQSQNVFLESILSSYWEVKEVSLHSGFCSKCWLLQVIFTHHDSHVKKNAEDEEAFDVLYCIAFEMMDAPWLAMHASYMEFNVLSCSPNSKFLISLMILYPFQWLFLVWSPTGGPTSNKNTIGERAVFRRRSPDTRSTSLQPVVPVAWVSAHLHKSITLFNIVAVNEGLPNQHRGICRELDHEQESIWFRALNGICPFLFSCFLAEICILEWSLVQGK